VTEGTNTNPLRGEVALKGESGKTYTIRLGTNALARMQKAFDEPTIKSLLNRLGTQLKGGDFSLVDLILMVQAAVVGDISEDAAGDLIDDCGLQPTLQAFTTSLTASLGQNSNGNQNPRKGSAKKKRPSSADS